MFMIMQALEGLKSKRLIKYTINKGTTFNDTTVDVELLDDKIPETLTVH